MVAPYSYMVSIQGNNYSESLREGNSQSWWTMEMTRLSGKFCETDKGSDEVSFFVDHVLGCALEEKRIVFLCLWTQRKGLEWGEISFIFVSYVGSGGVAIIRCI